MTSGSMGGEGDRVLSGATISSEGCLRLSDFSFARRAFRSSAAALSVVCVLDIAIRSLAIYL